jgi:hypothetical protein
MLSSCLVLLIINVRVSSTGPDLSRLSLSINEITKVFRRVTPLHGCFYFLDEVAPYQLHALSADSIGIENWIESPVSLENAFGIYMWNSVLQLASNEMVPGVGQSLSDVVTDVNRFRSGSSYNSIGSAIHAMLMMVTSNGISEYTPVNKLTACILELARLGYIASYHRDHIHRLTNRLASRFVTQWVSQLGFLEFRDNVDRLVLVVDSITLEDYISVQTPAGPPFLSDIYSAASAFETLYWGPLNVHALRSIRDITDRGGSLPEASFLVSAESAVSRIALLDIGCEKPREYLISEGSLLWEMGHTPDEPNLVSWATSAVHGSFCMNYFQLVVPLDSERTRFLAILHRIGAKMSSFNHSAYASRRGVLRLKRIAERLAKEIAHVNPTHVWWERWSRIEQLIEQGVEQGVHFSALNIWFDLSVIAHADVLAGGNAMFHRYSEILNCLIDRVEANVPEGFWEQISSLGIEYENILLLHANGVPSMTLTRIYHQYCIY